MRRYGAGVLRRVGIGRHLVVAAAVAVPVVLTLLGVVGAGQRDERFDAKQVLVTPVAGQPDAVRIREVVDQDFGTQTRRGYQRIIPNDFGEPIDIVAASPDAPSGVFIDQVVQNGVGSTRIRVGDPDAALTGQHRFVLSYTLPLARLTSGELALDIIGTDEKFETGRFEVVLAGFDLAEARCNTGGRGAAGGCSFEARPDGTLLAVIEPLPAGDGITVGGPIAAITEPPAVAEPPLPPRRDDDSFPMVLVAGPLALATAVGSFVVARRRGRNRVAPGGAADAAFAAATADGPFELVADDRLDDLVTTEFAPPSGIEPWEGRALLTETVDSDTVAAWFSGLIAYEAVELQRDPPVVSAGSKLHELAADDRNRVQALFAAGPTLPLDGYRPAMRTLWHDQQAVLLQRVRARNWWVSSGPGSLPQWPVAVPVSVGVALLGLGAAWFFGMWGAWWVALALAVAVPGAAALVAYAPLLAVRSVAGSAMALRTESFRRFLQASEGRHVDWAWSHGLLREYSAWAVALDAADAWSRAVGASSVPPTASNDVSPLTVFWVASALQHSTVPPSTSGSGGSGGGFSSGSVGGGGGGGSSGSW